MCGSNLFLFLFVNAIVNNLLQNVKKFKLLCCSSQKLDIFDDRLYFAIPLVYGVIVIPISCAIYSAALQSKVDGPPEWIYFQLVLTPFFAFVWTWVRNICIVYTYYLHLTLDVKLR